MKELLVSGSEVGELTRVMKATRETFIAVVLSCFWKEKTCFTQACFENADGNLHLEFKFSNFAAIGQWEQW